MYTISNTTNTRIIQVLMQENATSAVSPVEIRVNAILNPDEADTQWYKAIEISANVKSAYNTLISDATNAVNQRTDLSLKDKSLLLAAQATLAAINSNSIDFLPSSWTWSINA